MPVNGAYMGINKVRHAEKRLFSCPLCPFSVHNATSCDLRRVFSHRDDLFAADNADWYNVNGDGSGDRCTE